MTRIFPVLAAILAAGAFAPAARADAVLDELRACHGLGDSERLACFDRVLAQHEIAKEAPRQPEAQFGAERMAEKSRAATGVPEPLDQIRATITDYALSPAGKVIVTLANGQIWRQIQSDTERFKGRQGETAVIKRAIFGSYNLTLEGRNQLLKVERVR